MRSNLAASDGAGSRPAGKAADTAVFTYVTIPTTNNIQTELFNTFPAGTFIANNALGTPFSIAEFVGTLLGLAALSAKLKREFALIFAIVLAAGTARANILVNGSFESPVVPAGGGQIFSVGSDGITGWTVVGLSGQEVEVFSGTFTLSGINFPAEDGNQWLDLTGAHSNNLEGVSQTVFTVPGTTYTLTFWVGNVTGPTLGTTSSVGLKINGSPAGNYTNSTAATTMNWQKFTYAFIATGSTTAIEFDNLDPTTDNSNGLDNVDLEEGGSAAPVPVNLLVNGDFETPAIAAGSVLNVSSGSTDLTGWTVIGTAPLTVALVSGAYIGGTINFPAEDGHQWLDLTGTDYSTGTRGITQTVPTSAGMSYLLTFWVGNVFDPGGNFGTTSTVGLKINGTAAGNFTNSTPATTMNWQQFSATFIAVGNSTEIEFDNLDPPGDSSNGLDNVVLQQTASARQAPVIGAGGVVSASAFGEFTSVSPGSWMEIYGSNLAVDSRSWTAADFNGNSAPTSLDGTSVTIGGQAAFIDYISPGQVNALVPSNVATGVQQMTVTVGNVTSAVYSITVNPVEPGLLAPTSFNIGGIQYVVAQFADGTYVLPEGAIAGLNSRPAQPGDEIVIYGVGFGPVTPDIPAGQLVEQANTLASAFTMSIGGVPVSNVPYSGLAPNYTGLYQFNVVAPANAGAGAVPLTFTVDGVAGTQALYLAVSN
ncbi:MAG: DUF642 domain-containing protein [Bryobacteraceae bacterium]